jgi:hypothetical protein
MNAELYPQPRMSVRRSSALSAVLRIGLIAGTLDITDSLIFNQLRGVTPKEVFQFIASGLIGMSAFRAGMAAVALGVVLHFLIAISWTAIYYLASQKLTILLRRPVICGLLYGGLVYLFMNLVVLPLSSVLHLRAVTAASRINGVLAVMILIGLTISLLVRANSVKNPDFRQR